MEEQKNDNWWIHCLGEAGNNEAMWVAIDDVWCYLIVNYIKSSYILMSFIKISKNTLHTHLFSSETFTIGKGTGYL